MKNKIFKTISILLVVVFAIAGCKSNTKTDDKEKATVDIFQFKVEAKEALEAAADEYMKQNENITINIETVGGGDDYGAALKSRFASGKEPAIFNVGGLQDVYDWKDNLADLSQEPWVKAAFAGTLDSVTVDGKVYGLPFNQEGYGLIYNKAIFEKADIDPATITSFKALEEAVKKLDSMKDELELKAVFAFPAKETWVTGLHLANIQFANEFKSVNEAYEAKTIEMPYADAWKKLLDLQADYAYQPDGTRGSLNSVDYSTQVEEMFSIGRVALIQQGNWAYGSIAGIDEELASNIGLLPLPLEGVNEDSIPVGIPNYWAVNSAKSEAEVAAAKDFLNWLYTSEEGKKRIINDFKFIPAFSGYESDELQPSDPLAKDILRYSNEGKTMPWVFMGYPTGWGMDVLGADIQGYLLGDLSWEDLLKDAKDKWAEGRK
ncbi:ABC transporter substrate-binding protein [Vallitalea guaymasensis]|uniref:Carbohydrate ABC transporter substrate-binding protein n=1 Tax=Vallitalea guaymasensis TaxID=1185412 RepID=A0A8J8M7G7_9FIRM|nr:ABC transporter substrate-binding protein [Vallitalea guaymasensis]QUH27575.1 carbohydrate ABC transporter substrate-binding protein [Vallitalea guaymasensis]